MEERWKDAHHVDVVIGKEYCELRLEWRVQSVIHLGRGKGRAGQLNNR